MPAEKFLLKDHLFNTTKVTRVAQEIALVYPEFKTEQFIQAVIKTFPEFELMERLYWLRECLREYLPNDYQTAVGILVDALPPPLNPALRDNDFGDFIYGAFGSYVSQYGATKDQVHFSLAALQAMTTRFSCEFPIRVFIDEFPVQTLAAFTQWTHNSHYHVRRLVSEGSRPKLPWAKKISLDYKIPVQFLDSLYTDSTRYVTRSVANHVNDISKIAPDFAIHTLKRWVREEKQESTEMDYILRHSLRTLVKSGHPEALHMLGYTNAEVSVQMKILTPQVAVGKTLSFTVDVLSTSKKAQLLLVDYVLYWQKANGSLTPKTFKIKKLKLGPNAHVSFIKNQPLRLMSTRKLHPGVHQLELQINGQKYGKHTFDLVH